MSYYTNNNKKTGFSANWYKATKQSCSFVVVQRQSLKSLLLLILCFFCVAQVFGQEPKKTDSSGVIQYFNNDSIINQRNLADSLVSDSIYVDSLSSDSLVQTINPTETSDDFEADVLYKADDTTFIDLVNQEIHLINNAELKYQDIELKAYYIIINLKNSTITAFGKIDSLGELIGKPAFKEGEETYLSRHMIYNFKTKKARIKDVFMEQGETFMFAEDVKMINPKVMTTRNYRFSTCNNPEHQHYYLNISKAKYLADDKIVGGFSYLVVANTPLPVGLPFAYFPLTKGKKAGVIPPTFGESPTLGFFLQNGGYYFPINNKVDLAIRGDIYSLGSWALSANSNYAKIYKYNGNVNIRYSNQRFGDKEAADFRVNKDFLINWSHSQNPLARPGTTFSASVNAGTSTALANTSFNSTDFLQNSLNSSVNYGKTFAGKPYSFNTSLRHSQNTRDKSISLTLPDATFNVQRIQPFERKKKIGADRWYEQIGVSYLAQFSNQINGTDSTLFKGDLLEKMNLGVIHRIPINVSIPVLKYFPVTPGLNYEERWYFRSVNQQYNIEENRVDLDTTYGFFATRNYDFNIAVRTNLYGTYQTKKGKIAAVRHSFFPSFGFNYRPDFSTNSKYYGDVQIDSIGNTRKYFRFSPTTIGQPPAGKQGALNMNFDNNLEAKIRTKSDTGVVLKKIKIIDSFRFGTSYNIAADSLKWAAVAFNGRTTFGNNFQVQYGTTYDFYDKDLNGNRINQFLVNTQGKFWEQQSAFLTFSGSYQKNTQPQIDPSLGTPQEIDYITRNLAYFVDFNVPFNFGFNYNLNITRPRTVRERTQITQALSVQGDVLISQFWKVVVNTGYDFKSKQITTTNINILRDLHCWELGVSLIPFGQRQSYILTFRPKASLLQSLRLTRQRNWFDYGL